MHADSSILNVQTIYDLLGRGDVVDASGDSVSPSFHIPTRCQLVHRNNGDLGDNHGMHILFIIYFFIRFVSLDLDLLADTNMSFLGLGSR